MMIGSWYLLVPVLVPVLSGMALFFIPSLGDELQRRGRNCFVGISLILSAILLFPVLLSADLYLPLFTISDNLPIFFRTDLMGRFFSAVMCFVWAAVGCYSFEYMAHEENNRRYYAFYLVTLGVLMALCFSGSIVTFYMFYELMTLLSVPMIMHTMTKEAVAAGIKFLVYSVVGASLVLLGVFLLSPYTTTYDFVGGGVLDPTLIAGQEGKILVVVFLMIIGFSAKGGMFPLHGWLPTAHPAAPSPASAVLSGVITKAGVLGVVRLIYYFIGVEFLRGTWVQITVMSLSLFTVFMGSLLAMKETHLKKRLAWSSVSQISYILFGLSAMSPLALIGALLHVAAHSLIKDTLFMSAGAMILKTGKTQVTNLDGIGRQMPVVMWCFTIASIGLIGIPPCLGFISKWYLAEGALSMTGVPGFLRILGPAVLLISALLTAGYLLPVCIRAFFPGRDENGQPKEYEKLEPGITMLIPLTLLTAVMVLLGMFPKDLLGIFTKLSGLM